MTRPSRNAAAYAAAALALPCLAVNLPLFSLSLEGSPQTAAIFVSMVPGALLAIGWPDLKPRHAFVLPLLLAVCAPAVSFLLVASLAVFWPGVLTPNFASFGLSDLWSAHPIGRGWRLAPAFQVIVSSITAIGLWMGGRNKGILIRRSADDREELEQLHELLPECPGAKPVSLYRLQCLLGDSRSLTAEYRGQRLGVLPVFSMGREVVFVPPLAPSPAVRANLVRALLGRPELAFSDGITAALVDDQELGFLLGETGFVRLPVDDNDLDHIIAVRNVLESIGKERLLDPEYFSANRLFFRRTIAVERSAGT